MGTIASIAISVLVYQASKRHTQADFWRSLLDAWSSVDSVIIQSEKNLVAVEWLFGERSNDMPEPIDLDRRLKCQVAYLYLNPLAITFTGIDRGLVEKSVLPSLNGTLLRLFRDPEIFQLTQDSCLHPGFAEHCLGLQRRHSDSSPTASIST